MLVSSARTDGRLNYRYFFHKSVTVNRVQSHTCRNSGANRTEDNSMKMHSHKKMDSGIAKIAASRHMKTNSVWPCECLQTQKKYRTYIESDFKKKIVLARICITCRKLYRRGALW
ncbi:mutS family protein [Perkinsela sp. CCAP 1560/4]|nr:mutS family protein [Perkinsela sp. CCAP 1560/4]|eukprot:KNH04264.1 mutS family protein [Perkinsela sp. CCAP 1560/4]